MNVEGGGVVDADHAASVKDRSTDTRTEVLTEEVKEEVG